MPVARRLVGMLLLIVPGPSALRAVTPLQAGALVQHPAHYFDLQQRLVRFTARGPAAYDVSVTPRRGALDRGRLLGPPTDPGKSWRLPIPFAFPFGGRE